MILLPISKLYLISMHSEIPVAWLPIGRQIRGPTLSGNNEGLGVKQHYIVNSHTFYQNELKFKRY